jgi:hypothetical protein
MNLMSLLKQLLLLMPQMRLVLRMLPVLVELIMQIKRELTQANCLPFNKKGRRFTGWPVAY